MDGVFEYSDLASFDIAGFVEMLAECRVNLYKPHALGFVGGHAFWRSRIAPVHPSMGERDFFGELVAECTRNGIQVIPYMVFRFMNPGMAEAHPDHCARFEDGSIPSGICNSDAAYFWQPRYLSCINSPARRQYARDVIEEVLDLYPAVRHVASDADWYAAGICYCEACGKRYRDELGEDLPAGGFDVDVQSSQYRQYQNWQRQCVDEYAAFLRMVIRGRRPQAMSITGLSETLRFGHLDVQYRGQDVDAFTVEGTPLYLDGERYGPISQGHDEARYALAFGKPVFNVGSLTAREPMGLWIASGEAEGELKVFLAQSIACGFSPSPTAEVDLRDYDPRPMRILKEYYRFLEKHEDIFSDVQPAGEVALYWSSRALNVYGGDQKEHRYYRCFRGFLHAFTRRHVPFRMISDIHLTRDGLRTFKVLAMPNAAILSESDAEAIRDFVHSGGTLVCSYETSLYDENGRRRPDFLLADVLGAHYAGLKEVPRKEEVPSGQYNITGGMYLRTREPHPVLAGYPVNLCLPYDQYVIVDVPSDVVVPALTEPPIVPVRRAFEPLPDNEHTARLRELIGETNHPAIVVNSFGRGQSIYIPGRVGFSYAQYGHPELARLITNCAAASLGRFSVAVKAPPSVEMYLHRLKSSGRLMVNLVNYSGEPQRPYDQIVPVRNVEISADEALAGGAESARLLWADVRTPVQRREGRAVCTIDEIDVLECVIL